jgi:hypothetical protein
MSQHQPLTKFEIIPHFQNLTTHFGRLTTALIISIIYIYLTATWCEDEVLVNFGVLFPRIENISIFILCFQFLFAAQCRTSLGMQVETIPDEAITASSSYDYASVGPTNAYIYNLLGASQM